MRVPDVTFKTSVCDASAGGSNPFRWQDMTTVDCFAGKRGVLFSLSGAFTSTCSSDHLPGNGNGAAAVRDLGIDEIDCVSVNDSLGVNKSAQAQARENVKVILDGSGVFKRWPGMRVEMDNLGFGAGSRRYAAVTGDGVIEAWF